VISFAVLIIGVLIPEVSGVRGIGHLFPYRESATSQTKLPTLVLDAGTRPVSTKNDRHFRA
jgi:hypothetical protein